MTTMPPISTRKLDAEDLARWNAAARVFWENGLTTEKLFLALGWADVIADRVATACPTDGYARELGIVRERVTPFIQALRDHPHA